MGAEMRCKRVFRSWSRRGGRDGAEADRSRFRGDLIGCVDACRAYRIIPMDGRRGGRPRRRWGRRRPKSWSRALCVCRKNRGGNGSRARAMALASPMGARWFAIVEGWRTLAGDDERAILRGTDDCMRSPASEFPWGNRRSRRMRSHAGVGQMERRSGRRRRWLSAGRPRARPPASGSA